MLTFINAFIVDTFAKLSSVPFIITSSVSSLVLFIASFESNLFKFTISDSTLLVSDFFELTTTVTSDGSSLYSTDVIDCLYFKLTLWTPGFKSLKSTLTSCVGSCYAK